MTRPTRRRTAQLDRAAGVAPRRRWATYSAAGLVPVVLATLALVNPGVKIAQVDLNDGGVWLTQRNAQKLARFSTQVSELNGGLVTQGGSSFEVLQSGSDVVLVEPGALTIVDPAAVVLTSRVELAGTERVAMDGGTYAVTAPDGHVWAGRTEDLGGLALEPETATLELGAGAVSVVTASGGLVALDPATGTVHRGTVEDGVLALAPDGSMPEAAAAVTAALAAAPATGGVDAAVGGVVQPVQAAAVGDELVVLVGGILHGDGWSHDLRQAGPDPVLQLSGPDHDVVLVATTTSLVRAPRGGGEPEILTPGASGTAAAPVVARGCEYGGWSTPFQSYLRRCADGEVQVESLEGMTTGTQIRFRVNRGIVVVNDVAEGLVWLPEDVPTLLTPNWQDIEDRTESDQQDDVDAQDQEKDDTVDRCRAEESVPMPTPDEFGVRAGRTTVLPVLDNDVNVECGVLTVASVDPLPEDFGTIQTIAGGRSLQVVMRPGATGTQTVTYTVSDGRRREAPPASTLTITVSPEGANDEPEQVRVPVVQVEARATTEVDVLGSFLDPDGDDLRLVGARVDDGAQVTTRQDGLLTFTAGDRLGRHTVTVSVTDGTNDEVEGRVLVDVRAAGTLTPQIDPVIAQTFVGQEVVVDVLGAVRPTTAEAVVLMGVEQPEGTFVTPDLAAGRFTFSAPSSGSYYVAFTVAAGANQATGLARVEVTEPPDQVLPPVAVSDRAMLPNGGEVTIEPTANDSDPNGFVLVLTSVEAEEGSSLRLGVLQHHRLRITSTRTLEEPETIRYTVSNGVAEATGEVLVVPVSSGAEDRAPVVPDVEVSVRTGGVVTIPVLADAYDPDGDAISLAPDLAEPVDAGLMFVSGDVLRYQAPAEPTTARARFTVVDPFGNETSARVTISVHASDPSTKSPPRPEDLEARVLSGQTVRITVPLVGIDDDGDGVLLLGQASAPTKGRIVAQGPDHLEYEAFPDSTGTDTFTYAVEDWVGQRAVATIRVGISQPPAVPPSIVARDDEVRVRPGERVEVRVLLNDVDPSGGELSIETPLEEVEGLDELGVEGRRIVARAPDEPGTYNVPYRVVNALGGWATAVLSIVVATDAEILPPIASDVVVPATETINKTSVEVDVLAVAMNPSGPLSDLQVSVPTSHADQAQVTPAGKIRVTLGPTSRTIPFLLTNTRPEAGGVSAYAFVTVSALGDFPPILRPKARELRVGAGEELLIDIAEFVQVGPGKTATLTSEEAVSATRSDGSSLVVDGTTLRYVAQKDFPGGPASITFEVADGPTTQVGTRVATLTLPITVFATASVPPTFRPTLLEVAQGGSPVALDLTRVTVGPEGAVAEQNRYTYAMSSAPAGSTGVTATLQGSVLTLSAVPGAARGAVGAVGIVVGYGDGATLPAQVEFRVLASDRQLARVATFEREAVAGQPLTVPVLEGAFNPFSAPLRVVAAQAVTSGVQATVSISDSTVTVTPPAGFIGRLSVRFSVRDETDDPARQVDGTVSLEVSSEPDVPAAPVVVGEPRSREVDLSWTAPTANGKPVTQYQVRDSSGTVTQCATTGCTIRGLRNGTEYRFQVQAMNAVGWSDWSAMSSPTTPDTVPEAPAAPTLTFTDGGLGIAWTQPATEGSPVARYRVEVVGPGAPTTPLEVSGTSTSVSGLTNGSRYTVRVRAVSSRDQEGPWSPSSAEIPAGVPGAPRVTASRDTSVIGGQVIKASWADAASNGAEIKSYTVTATPQGGGRVFSATTSSTSQDFKGVENGVTYSIAVTATNKAGTGAEGTTTARTWKRPGLVTTLPTQPYTDNEFGNGRATYAWKPVTDTGGAGIAIDHYVVDDGVERKTVTGTSYTVAGLPGGRQSPTMKVRACTFPEAGGSAVCSAEWSTLEAVHIVTRSKPASVRFRKPGAGYYAVVVSAPSEADSGGSAVKTTYTVTVGDRTHTGTLATDESVTIANDVTNENDAVAPGSRITVTTRTTNALGQTADFNADDFVESGGEGRGPTGIVSRSTTPGELHVAWTWDRPRFWTFKSYKVYYRPKGGSSWALGKEITDVGVREWKHGELVTGGDYEIRVVVTARSFFASVDQEFVGTGQIRVVPVPEPEPEPEPEPTTDPDPDPGTGGDGTGGDTAP